MTVRDDDFTLGSWSKAELTRIGFDYYESKRVVTMIRELAADESPLTIEIPGGPLVAEAGYLICFAAEHGLHTALYDYPHWPAAPEWFAAHYDPVDDPSWAPTAAQRHLMSLGCMPYVRRGGAWAKRVTRATKVQSAENPTPVIVPPGTWVCALVDSGVVQGFWAMDDGSFHRRYESRARSL